MPILGWRALKANGEVCESRAMGAGLAASGVCEATLHIDSGGLVAKVRPERGEQLRVFTRRQMAGGVSGPTGEIVDTVVVEITTDPDHPERFVRLYVCPLRGVMLSTSEE